MTAAPALPNSISHDGSINSMPSHEVPRYVDNPLPHVLPEGENATPLEVIGSTASDKLVIIMVGLPATGKTHIAKRICRFLSFFHDIPSQIFNVGDYRRELCGAQLPAQFYSPDNPEGVAARKIACDAALADLVDYISQDGVRVAALDATNSTFERRQHIIQTLSEKQGHRGIKKMFVESVCDDESILKENIQKVKLSTPDYKDMDPDQAVQDFLKRRENYMAQYEPVTEKDGPFCRIINSKKFIVSNIRGYLPLKVVHFVMNLHMLPRTFYLTRHGQSEYNLLGKIGGDSGLTPAGIEYARRLAVFAKEEIAKRHDLEGNVMDDSEISEDANGQPKQRPCRLWTSTLRRTQETAQFIQHDTISHTFDNGDTLDWVQFRQMPRRNLDELYAGTCDGMTYKEIEQVFPEEFARRQADKLSYRYPRGESYMDVTLRLEPLAQEMERTREPVLIIGHQGILRILYAYFMGLDRKEAPYVSIPLNNVIELTPHAYGCHEKRYCLMMKEEMLKDGQDEPVTSMPMAAHEGLHDTPGDEKHYSENDDVPSQLLTPTAVQEAAGVRAINSEYSPLDPVMNAPSC
ncbi:bifunctional 6-phosphofructo-2-kinase [Nitzschia inconspicua]|uniref:Bifunctional 6-phosphofructo-2-kinase n=1 Tax=Nitzschia inconspicua TaxID=303405 RepID=A0A9K3PG75_9STRA|nr:bifunctional 6-phosphofructo-2-kinase [Nitzschia inconspicua]